MTDYQRIVGRWRKSNADKDDEIYQLRMDNELLERHNAQLREKLQKFQIQQMEESVAKFMAAPSIQTPEIDHTIATYHLFIQGRNPQGKFEATDTALHYTLPSCGELIGPWNEDYKPSQL